MTDRVVVRDVRALGTHGVLPEEHTTAQPFVVDVTCEIDLTHAGAGDDLTDTVNYAEIARDVVDVVQGPHVDLIERLAERIAETVLTRPLVEAVEVCVHKPEAPVGVPFGDVAVSVRREQDRPVVIALGSNRGDPLATLASAVRALADLPGVTVRGLSPIFDTDPVGGPDQPAFLNAVALLRTRLAPGTLLRRMHRIEDDHGRTRDVPWGPRTLDLDLVQVGDPLAGSDLLGHRHGVMLPHPRAHERVFVLLPWMRADPGAVLRVGDRIRRIGDLLDDIGADPEQGIRPGPAWPVELRGCARA